MRFDKKAKSRSKLEAAFLLRVLRKIQEGGVHYPVPEWVFQSRFFRASFEGDLVSCYRPGTKLVYLVLGIVKD